MSEIKPGLYERVPRAVYESWDAVNHSKLKLFDEPPAKARYLMAHPPEPTEALDLGDATHAAVLEPPRFEADFIAAPAIERRSKQGKTAWKAFMEANRSRIVLPADDYTMCLAMRDAVWADESEVKAILSAPGRNELSFVWRDLETQLLCKGRCDRLVRWNGWTVVPDV